MKYSIRQYLSIGMLCLFINSGPGPIVYADNHSDSVSGIVSHPEVAGALAAIDAWIEGVRVFEKLPGVSVGIVYDQDLIWSKGYGYANVKRKRVADLDTLYSICSISKLFTSIGVMQLRDKGVLQLRDPVRSHLDWFNIRQAHPGSADITIESLLTHSSGLPRESENHYWNGPDFPFPTRQQMIEGLSVRETLYPAQMLFQYSNLAMSVAGEIVQEKSGQEYASYIQEHILSPLEMRDTRTYYPKEKRGKQLAIGYSGLDRSGKRKPVRAFFAEGITPAAGFTSSVRDLARFASWQFAVLDAQVDAGTIVLDANTLREMHRVHWVDPNWELTWGLGFSVRQAEGATLVGHSGGCPGYITNFSMLPKHKLAVVVLTNAGDAPAGQITINILKTIAPALKQALSAMDDTAMEDAAEDLSRFTGNFDTAPWGGEMAVRQWGDELVVIGLPSDDLSEASMRLRHEGGETFVRLTDDDEEREPWIFEMDNEGIAQGIIRHSYHLNRID